MAWMTCQAHNAFSSITSNALVTSMILRALRAYDFPAVSLPHGVARSCFTGCYCWYTVARPEVLHSPFMPTGVPAWLLLPRRAT